MRLARSKLHAATTRLKLADDLLAYVETSGASSEQIAQRIELACADIAAANGCVSEALAQIVSQVVRDKR